jgi:hypothetical protein
VHGPPVLAQLIDELLGQPLQIGPGELLVDAVVLPRALIKGAGDCRDGLDPAEAVIQETLHRSHLPCSGHPTVGHVPRIAHRQTV